MIFDLHSGHVPTDSPQTFSVPGFSIHREMRVMAAAGLTPFEILQSGTRNVAVYFNTLAETGTIEQGKRRSGSTRCESAAGCFERRSPLRGGRGGAMDSGERNPTTSGEAGRRHAKDVGPEIIQLSKIGDRTHRGLRVGGQ